MRGIRSGQYARYRGEEYQAGYSFPKKQYILTTEEVAAADFGFVSNEAGIYVKRVAGTELEELYTIQTFGLYREEKVELFRLAEGYYLSRTSEGLLAEKLGYVLQEPGVYNKMIPTDDIERVWEEKTPARIIM